MKNNRQFGFTLIELMVVVGLIGVVLLGSMRLFSDVFRTANQVEAGQDMNLLVEAVSKTISNQTTCTSLFKGVLNQEKSQIVLGARFAPGQRYGKVEVAEAYLGSTQKLTEQISYADLVLVVKDVGGRLYNPRFLPILYSVDTQGRIDSCLGNEISQKGNCTSLGGVWNVNTCDLCPAMGGIKDSNGLCQMDEKNRPTCPMQKAFAANGSGNTCSGWDADFAADSLEYLSSFHFLNSEVVDAFRKDLSDFVNKPPDGPQATKIIGSSGMASWILNMEPGDSSGRPCQTSVVINVQCP